MISELGKAVPYGVYDITANAAWINLGINHDTAITVCHLPPGTSKWNRIGHKLFAFITQNWRGKPLVSHEVIVQLIANTTTRTGLGVACRIDRGDHEKGIKITDTEMASLNIQHADFHGEWNYAIRPKRDRIMMRL